MLLTRSPLYSSPCGDFLVRLACVRHAASVDSEPGSNSRLKLGSPTDSAVPGSSTVLRRHGRRPDSSLQVLSCELSSRLRPEGEYRSTPCPELLRTGFASGVERIAQRYGHESLKDSVQLTWHAQLNCQRALSPAEGGVPQLGKVGKLTPEATLIRLMVFPCVTL